MGLFVSPTLPRPSPDARCRDAADAVPAGLRAEEDAMRRDGCGAMSTTPQLDPSARQHPRLQRRNLPPQWTGWSDGATSKWVGWSENTSNAACNGLHFGVMTSSCKPTDRRNFHRLCAAPCEELLPGGRGPGVACTENIIYGPARREQRSRLCLVPASPSGYACLRRTTKSLPCMPHGQGHTNRSRRAKCAGEATDGVRSSCYRWHRFHKTGCGPLSQDSLRCQRKGTSSKRGDRRS